MVKDLKIVCKPMQQQDNVDQELSSVTVCGGRTQEDKPPKRNTLTKASRLTWQQELKKTRTCHKAWAETDERSEDTWEQVRWSGKELRSRN